ncbi:MAG: heavy-metal-associated domain-containing protein [archaeon]|nr:heavy-metal-associated domain-containing protein [archaeon]
MANSKEKRRIRVRIVGMDCYSCSLVLDKMLKGVKGVERVWVNYVLDTVFVEFDPNIISEDDILLLIKEKTGYEAFIHH